MKEWLFDQVYHFNLISFVAIIVIVTVMGKANISKLLKEQSQEFYQDMEELKQEIRGNSDKVVEALRK